MYRLDNFYYIHLLYQLCVWESDLQECVWSQTPAHLLRLRLWLMLTSSVLTQESDFFFFFLMLEGEIRIHNLLWRLKL